MVERFRNFHITSSDDMDSAEEYLAYRHKKRRSGAIGEQVTIFEELDEGIVQTAIDALKPGSSKKNFDQQVKNLTKKQLISIVSKVSPKSARRVLSPSDYMLWKVAYDRLSKEVNSGAISEATGKVDVDHRGKPITMQDVRLIAGEGKLSKKTIQQAVKVVKKNRKHLVGKAFHDPKEVDESLNLAQRRKRSISFRKNKSKIRIGQARARKRMASKETLEKRSRKAARNLILKKLTNGKGKNELDFARRESMEKRLDRMKGKIDVVARKLYPQIRKLERERKTKSKENK